MTTNVTGARGTPNQLAFVQTAASAPTSPITCDSGVSADLKGLSVTPQLTPALTAIWNHPIFGGGGVYVGTGGLSLFQVDLDGTITLNLGVSVSGQGTCTLTTPEVKTVVPAGDLGVVVLAAQPKLTLTVSGKLDLRTSVTLTCSTEYRWESGVETRLSYCKPSNQPLTLSSDSGVDEVLTAAIDARVTLDDIVGMTGQLNASVHAGYHPADHPIAFIDASAGYELNACLACLWPRSPAKVSIASGTFFNQRIAVWDTPPPPVTTPLQITATSLPAGNVGQAYSVALTAAGGTGAYTWTLSTGQLPAGLNLDPLTGTITGTPTTPGTSTITATVTDAANTTAALTATLNIQGVATGLADVRGIFTNDLTSFAVKSDGAVWAWGSAPFGNLSSINASNVPLEVTGVTGVQSISAGGYTTYALKTDGTVWAWGFNERGQLGNGTTADSIVPVQVRGLTGVTKVITDGRTALALKSDRTVWAWGENSYGQLGNGTTANSNVPVQVTNLSDISAVAFGLAEGTAVALKTDGTVWAWGRNTYGEVANGTTTPALVPLQVTGLSGVQNITYIGMTVFALKADGTVWAWGGNPYGQLGNGTIADSAVPAQVQGGLSGVRNIAFNGYTVFALKTDGTVSAWGYGGDGALGNGTSGSSRVPVQVTGLTGVEYITTTSRNMATFALKSDGTVWAWGSNSNGQLGNGTTAGSDVPMQVVNLTGVRSVTTNLYESIFALKADGTVWAWGNNWIGQLGIGTNTDSKVPVQVG